MRLIDADKLKRVINDYYPVMNHRFAFDAIDLQPTVDPWKHGKWIKLDGDWKSSETNEPVDVHQCSVCGTYYMNAPYKHCPYCGARMDE